MQKGLCRKRIQVTGNNDKDFCLFYFIFSVGAVVIKRKRRRTKVLRGKCRGDDGALCVILKVLGWHGCARVGKGGRFVE